MPAKKRLLRNPFRTFEHLTQNMRVGGRGRDQHKRREGGEEKALAR